MSKRVLFLVVIAGVGVAVACTNDFEQFEGASGSSTDGGTTSSSSGGSTGSSTSSSTSSGGDSSTPPLPPVDCPKVSGSCFTQATTCRGDCDATHTTCTQACEPGGQGKQCRNQCDSQRTTCYGPCLTTCEQCAGPPCRDQCPQ